MINSFERLNSSSIKSILRLIKFLNLLEFDWKQTTRIATITLDLLKFLIDKYHLKNKYHVCYLAELLKFDRNMAKPPSQQYVHPVIYPWPYRRNTLNLIILCRCADVRPPKVCRKKYACAEKANNFHNATTLVIIKVGLWGIRTFNKVIILINNFRIESNKLFSNILKCITVLNNLLIIL